MVDLATAPSYMRTRQPIARRVFRLIFGDLGVFGFIFWIVVLLTAAVFFGIPLLWLLLAPSKTDNELLKLVPLAFGTLNGYAKAWANLNTFNSGVVTQWAINSLWYSLASLILSLVLVIPAGYALATARFRGRRTILFLTLLTMIIPGSALVLPLFLEVNSVGLVNTPWAVIIPSAFFPFGAYLSYIYFSTSLPKDLLAAARVDGASEWQLFWYLGLPLARTLLGLLAFLSFTANWNNYFLPFVMLNNNALYTLPLGIQALITGTSAITPTFATDLPLKRPEAALLGLITVLPVAIVFLFSQRYVISGALTGATKE
jgi:multiple sugar transport system permease protein